jgi:hypothetical protein
MSEQSLSTISDIRVICGCSLFASSRIRGSIEMFDQVIEAGDLRIVFQWRGDRYGHTVERRIDGQWRSVLESLEGSSDDDWPQSPALQDLHIERRGSGPVALLVGKSGTSHWSVSVEALAGETALRFDVACRLHRSPRWLGSTYRVIAGQVPPLDIVALPGEAICELEPPTQWRVRPAEVASAYPATIRWRYSIARENLEPR